MIFSRFERLIAYRYLRSPRQEGFVSVIAGFSFLGIALGVATLIIVMSVMNGFRAELLTRLIGMRGHILVHGLGPTLSAYEKGLETVSSVPGVTAVYPIIDRQAILNVKSQARGIGIVGISKESLEKRDIIAKNLNQEAFKLFQGDHVLIGRRLADHMGLKISDRLVLLTPEGTMTAFGQVPRQKAFTVGGIFEVGMHDFDKNIIFMPLDTAQNLFKMENQISHMEVFTSHAELAPHLAEILQSALGNQMRVLDWQHGDSQIFHAVQVERNVMFLILTLIILIASFNIISSLIMLVKDKTRDMAILRTMGASRLSLLRIFLLTGASIGVVGTLLGVGLGLSFALNIESIRQFLQSLTGTELFSAEIYFLSQLPAKVDWHEVVTVVGMALTLSFLATLYPAWRAASLDPVEALRS